MSFKRIFVGAAILLLTPPVEALGLGELSSNTLLGEKILARIEIVGDDVTDLDTVRVGLASAESFKQAGISLNSYLLELSFRTYQDNSGNYVEITSHKPVLEPYLNFLVELQWGGVQLFRKYALLIDPPPVRSDRVEFASNDKVDRAISVGRFKNSENILPNPGEYVHGPVTATDTLWSISEKLTQDGPVTVNQMMLALVEANPDSFGYGNVNFLRKGAYLRMPSESELERHNRSRAQEIVLRHHESWTGLVSKKQSKQTALTRESLSQNPSDRLEVIVPVETETNGKGLEARLTTAQSQLMKEEIDTRSQLNEELSAKLREAEGIISLLQKQVRMQDEQLVLLQGRLSKLENGPSELLPSEMKFEQQNTELASVSQNGAEDRPFYEFGWGPFGWLIILVLLFVQLAFIFFITKSRLGTRKESKDAEGDAKVVDSTGNGSYEKSHEQDATEIDAQNPVIENSLDESASFSVESLQPDLLEEINIHLAYEEYQKAESLVKVAIENNPSINGYKLWLLRIYSAAGNVSAFRESVPEILAKLEDDYPIRKEINTMWDALFPDQSLSSFLDTKSLAEDVSSSSESEESEKRQPDNLGIDDGHGSMEGNGEESVDTKFDDGDLGNNLNLARAYIELGDDVSARKLLEQIAKDGNKEESAEARSLLLKL